MGLFFQSRVRDKPTEDDFDKNDHNLQLKRTISLNKKVAASRYFRQRISNGLI